MSEEHLYPVLQFAYETRFTYDGNDRSKEEAINYAKNFQRSYPYRVLVLLAWLDECITGVPAEDLERIGLKVSEFVKLSEYHETYKTETQYTETHRRVEEFKQLSIPQMSMSIDMGFLLGVFLAQLDTPDIEWNMRMRGKTCDGYHQMTLVWKGKTITYDPIADSIGWSNAIAQGKRSHRIWCEFYLRWQDILEGREPRNLIGV